MVSRRRSQGGLTYGATDEYGYKVVENKLLMHDLHATILHLLGMDHTKLTFRFGGRDMRLTDVHGENHQANSGIRIRVRMRSSTNSSNVQQQVRQTTLDQLMYPLGS